MRDIKKPQSFGNRKRVITVVLLSFVLLSTFLVRFIGADFGLPLQLHHDEKFIVNPAIGIADGKLDSGWYGSPGSTLMYANGFFFFLYTKAANLFTRPSSVAELFQKDPTPFFLIGRILVILLSTLTVFLVFLIAKIIYCNSWSAYFSAILLAISYLYVKHSRFITPDIPAAFFIVLLLYFSLKIIETRQLKYYIFSGAALGLAIATKYPCVIGLVLIIFAHFLSLSHKQFAKKIKHLFLDRKIWIAFLACIAAFLVAMPFFIPNFSVVIRDIQEEARSTHLSADHLDFVGKLRFYSGLVQREAFGKFGRWALGMAILLVLVRRNKKEVLLLSFPLFFWIFLSALELHWERWFIPAIPFLAIILGGAIFYWVKKIPLFWAKTLLILLFVYFIFFPIIVRTSLIMYALTKEDTRTQVEAWQQGLDPSTKVIAHEGSLDKADNVHVGSIYNGAHTLDEFDYLVTLQTRIDKFCNFDQQEECAFHRRLSNSLLLEHRFESASIKIPYLHELPIIGNQMIKLLIYPGPTLRVYQGMNNVLALLPSEIKPIYGENIESSYDLGIGGDMQIVILPTQATTQASFKFEDTDQVNFEVQSKGKNTSSQIDLQSQASVQVTLSGQNWFLIKINNPQNKTLQEVSFSSPTALAIWGNVKFTDQQGPQKIILQNPFYPKIGSCSLKVIHKKGRQEIVAVIDGQEEIINLPNLYSQNTISYQDVARLDIEVKDIVINSNGLIWLDPESWQAFKKAIVK